VAAEREDGAGLSSIERPFADRAQRRSCEVVVGDRGW